MSDKQFTFLLYLGLIGVVSTVVVLVQQYFFATTPVTCSCGDTVAQSVGFWAACGAAVIWAICSAVITGVVAAVFGLMNL